MSRDQSRGGICSRWEWKYHLGLLVGLLLCPALVLGETLTITPSARVGVRYDSNIFQVSDDRKIDDTIIEVEPAIQIHYEPSEPTLIDFEYRPTFEFFIKNPDENDIDHLLRLLIDYPISRIVRVELNERLSITRDSGRRIQDIDVDDGINENTDRLREQVIRNRLGAAVRFQLAPRSNFGVIFDSLYEDVERFDRFDELRLEFGGEFAYLTNIARNNRFLIRYVAESATFSDNCGNAPTQDQVTTCENELEAERDAGEFRDFQLHTPSIGYLHNFNPTLTLLANVGYSITTSRNNDIDGNGSPVGNVRLDKTFSKGALGLEYRGRFGTGRDLGGQTFNNRGTVVFEYDPTAKLATGLEFTIVRVDFQDPRQENSDRYFYSVRPRLAYRALRWWRLSASYIWGFTDFDPVDRPNRTDNDVIFVSQFILRAGLSLDLTYRFRDRSFSSVEGVDSSTADYTRHQVMLSITYGPTFRFF